MASYYHIEASGAEAIGTCWKQLDCSGSVNADQTLAVDLCESLAARTMAIGQLGPISFLSLLWLWRPQLVLFRGV